MAFFRKVNLAQAEEASDVLSAWPVEETMAWHCSLELVTAVTGNKKGRYDEDVSPDPTPDLE